MLGSIRIQLYLLLSIQSLVAIEPSDVDRIIGSDDTAITISGPDSGIIEDQQTFLNGGSSLAFRTVEIDGVAILDYSIQFAIPGPGIYEFHTKTNLSDLPKGNRSHVRLEIETDNDRHIESTTIDDWVRFRFFSTKPDEQFTIHLEGQLFEGHQLGLSFLLDKARFLPGYQIVHNVNPEFGSISISPQKAIYNLGDTVEFSIAPIEGHRLAGARRTEWSAETVQFFYYDSPNSNRFTIEGHNSIDATFDRRLNLGALDAWTRVVDSNPIVENPDGSYQVRYLTIEGDFPFGVLTFEARSLGGGSISVSNTIEEIFSIENAQEFETISTVISPTDEIHFNLDEAAIRNIDFSTIPQVLVSVLGKGSVEVEYTPSSEPGTRIAKLTATPDPDWEFSGWTNGLSSNQIELEIILDRPIAITANFAQVFRFGGTRWAFSHSGNVEIITSDGTDGEPLISVSTIYDSVHVGLELTILEAGPIQILERFIDPNQSPFPDFQAMRLTNLDYEGFVRSTPYTHKTIERIQKNERWEIGSILTGGGINSNDIGFELAAPEGSVSVNPDSLNYDSGDHVELDVREDFPATFLGWRGDLYSNDPTIAFEIQKFTNVHAVFEREHTTQSSDLITLRGPILFEEAPSDGLYALESPPIPHGAWAEIEFDISGPLVLQYGFERTRNNLELTFWQGETLLETLTGFSGTGRFLEIPQNSLGKLRLFAINRSHEEQSLKFEATGYFQKVIGGGEATRRDFEGGSVTLQFAPEGYYQVGSSILISPDPDHGFDFVGWRSPSLSSDENTYTISHEAPLVLDPIFEPNFYTDRLEVQRPISPDWDLGEGPSIKLAEPLKGISPKSFTFKTNGPGVLAFDIEATAPFLTEDPVNVVARIDGTPTSLKEARSQVFGWIYEALIPPGLHELEIEISLVPETLANPFTSSFGVPVRIEEIRFTEGFVIRKRYEEGLDFEISPESQNGVYSEGQSVVLTAQIPNSATFKDWNGPLSGSPASVEITVDQHILTNPTTDSLSSIGPITVSIEPGTLHTFTKTQDESRATLDIKSESGPTTVSFEIPALTELSFDLADSSTPVRIVSDGKTIYEGLPKYSTFGFPTRAIPYNVVVEIDFDPEILSNVRFDKIIAFQDFELALDSYDPGEPQLIVEPAKERYLPGELVTVTLDEDVPPDWVFYDIILSYPNLPAIEWLPAENVRSFEIEMKSNAALLVATGLAPQRETGTLIASSEMRIEATDQFSPDGTPVNTWRINPNPFPNFFRIRAGDSARVNFWARIPARQSWILSGIANSEAPTILEGDSAWRQFSLSVDHTINYLSFFIVSNGSDAYGFNLSEIELSDQMGPSFISRGNGSVRLTQSSTLEAFPNEGHRFSSWGNLTNTADLSIDFQDLDEEFVFPSFVPTTPPITLDGFTFETTGLPPATITENNTPAAIEFRDRGESVATALEGPAVFHYDANSIGNGLLHVFLDGSLVHTHGNSSYPPPDPPFVILPKGIHNLEFRYHEVDVNDSIRIENFSIENVVSINLPKSEFGQFEITPEKQFYEIGEKVTISVNPLPNYYFSHWSGDIESNEEPLQLLVDDHLSLEGLFYYKSQLEINGIKWEVLTRFENQKASIAQTELEGPGLLLISETNFLNSSGIFTINGATLPATVNNGTRYMPIPKGNFVIEYSGAQDASELINQTRYQPGYAVLLTGDASFISVDPMREIYPPGSNVSIDWIQDFKPHPDSIFRINGIDSADSLPIELEVQEHVILDIEHLSPFSNTGLYSIANTDIKLASSGLPFSQSLSFEFGHDLNSEDRIFQSLYLGGIIEFTVENVGSDTFETYLDGIKLASIVSEGVYSIRIPPGGAEIQWRKQNTTNNRLDGSTIVKEIKFIERDYSDHENWISQYAPSHVFALSDRLGPIDDLDLDGFSNSEERSKGLNPYLYTFDASIRKTRISEKNPLAIVFETRIPIDTSRVSVLSLVSGVWLSFPLENLKFEESLRGDGHWEYEIPIEQLGSHDGFFKIGISPAIP